MVEKAKNSVKGAHILPPVGVKNRAPFLISIAFILFACLGAAIFWASFNKRTSTVVAARDIPHGVRLTAADLKVVETSGVANGFSEIDDLVGRPASHRVSEGDILSGSSVGSSVAVSANQTVIGVLLRPGGYPTRTMAAGDVVDVFSVEGSVAQQVKVYDVSIPDSSSSQEMLLSLVLSPEQAASVAKFASQDNGVRVALRGTSS